MVINRLQPFFLRHSRMILLLLLLFPHANLSMSEGEKKEEDDFDDELYSIVHFAKDGSLWNKSRHTRSINLNRTAESDFASDNSLWDNLWFECKNKPSFSCVRTGMFRYLDKSLEKSEDFSLTDSLFFRKNKNKFNGVCENSEDEKNLCLRYDEEKLKMKEKDLNNTDENTIQMSENEIDNSIEDTSVNNNSTSITKKDNKETEEKEDILEGAENGRTIPSLNDVSDMLYDKGSHFLMTHDVEFQLPELFFGGGSVKIEPKNFIEGDENEEEGTMVKIVFRPPQPPPSDHIIKGRLFGKLKKMFKKKLMHSFMALMLIVKMIKVKLMFLVPMLVGKATAKKLLLKVLLFLIPGLTHLFKLCHYYHMEHAKYHHHHHKIKHHHHHIKVPVPVPVPVHVDPNIPHFDPYGKPSGPSGGGYDYPPYPPSHNPSGYDDYDYPGNSHGNLNNYYDNEAYLSSWGLGSSNIHEAGVLDAKNQHLYFKNHPYAGHYGGDHVGAYSQQYVNNAHLLTVKPPLNGPVASYDAFYSPILQKIDNVFVQMGFNDEPCRERLVCSMYKTPHLYSPHSNLLSNELSRDAKDLQKPVVSNAAVLRFYRYIQAARDGQDQKDCLRLYPSCHINTESL